MVQMMKHQPLQKQEDFCVRKKKNFAIDNELSNVIHSHHLCHEHEQEEHEQHVIPTCMEGSVDQWTTEMTQKSFTVKRDKTEATGLTPNGKKTTSKECNDAEVCADSESGCATFE